MPGPSGEACEKCYFARDCGNPSYRTCCLKPPRWMKATEEFEQPHVMVDRDWCGEFKPLKPEGTE